MTTTRKRTIRASFALRPAFDRRYQYQVSHVRSRRIIRVHPRSPRSKTSHRGWSAQKAKRASSSGSSCAFRQVFGPFGGPRSPLAPLGGIPRAHPRRAPGPSRTPASTEPTRARPPPLATMAATPLASARPVAPRGVPAHAPAAAIIGGGRRAPARGFRPSSRRRPAPLARRHLLPRARAPPPPRPPPRVPPAPPRARRRPTRSPAAARGGTRWSCTP